MKLSGLWRAIAVGLGCTVTIGVCAQSGTSPTSSSAAVVTQSPFTTQVKKTVVFLETDCLHDFKLDVAKLTPDALAKLEPNQVEATKQQLVTLLLQLQSVKASKAKLSVIESAMLNVDFLRTLSPAQIGDLVVKMTNFTVAEIADLSPSEADKLPRDSHLGTGFIV